MEGFHWERAAAIVLAAGSGSRMKQSVKKQFIPVNHEPLFYHSLKAFSDVGIGGLILVTAGEDMELSRRLLEKYTFSSPVQIVEGGRERYHSVYQGLRQAAGYEYIFIHDGARPCLERRVIEETALCAAKYGACAAAVPVKDTIKLVDGEGFAAETLDRSRLWAMQTPQTFRYDIVKDAYDKMFESPMDEGKVTDDAMVVERYSSCPVKMAMGSYRNIKVTTPEDLTVAEKYMKEIYGDHEGDLK